MGGGGRGSGRGGLAGGCQWYGTEGAGAKFLWFLLSCQPQTVEGEEGGGGAPPLVVSHSNTALPPLPHPPPLTGPATPRDRALPTPAPSAAGAGRTLEGGMQVLGPGGDGDGDNRVAQPDRPGPLSRPTPSTESHLQCPPPRCGIPPSPTGGGGVRRGGPTSPPQPPPPRMDRGDCRSRAPRKPRGTLQRDGAGPVIRAAGNRGGGMAKEGLLKTALHWYTQRHSDPRPIQPKEAPHTPRPRAPPAVSRRSALQRQQHVAFAVVQSLQSRVTPDGDGVVAWGAFSDPRPTGSRTVARRLPSMAPSAPSQSVGMADPAQRAGALLSGECTFPSIFFRARHHPPPPRPSPQQCPTQRGRHPTSWGNKKTRRGEQREKEQRQRGGGGQGDGGGKKTPKHATKSCRCCQCGVRAAPASSPPAPGSAGPWPRRRCALHGRGFVRAWDRAVVGDG